MFRKLLGLFGLALLLLVGESFFMVQEAEAANKRSRCRASTAAGLAKCKALIGEKNRKVTARRTRAKRPRYQTSLRSQRHKMTSNTSAARRRVSTRRQVFNKTTARTDKGQAVARQKVQARIIDFPFTVDPGFEVQSDNLTADQGSLVLSDGEATIRFVATGDRCDQARTGIRSCLRDLVNKEIKNIQAYQSFPYLEKNTEKRWGKTNNINPYQLSKSNSGRYLLMSTQKDFFGRFFFFEPTKEFVWRVEIDSPKANGSFLQDESSVDRMLLSLFVREDVKKVETAKRHQRTSTATNKRSVAKRKVRRGARVKITNRDAMKHTAQNIPFSVSLPTNMTAVSDNLNWEDGMMSFAAEDGTRVFIAATTETCTSQTPRIIRGCIEDAAEKMIRRQGTPFLAQNLLQARNYNLSLNNASGNLLRSQSFNKEIGRFHLYRANGKRYAQLVFRVPVKHQLWTMIIEAPEKNDAILSDTRQLQKTFSSLFFKDL